MAYANVTDRNHSRPFTNKYTPTFTMISILVICMHNDYCYLGNKQRRFCLFCCFKIIYITQTILCVYKLNINVPYLCTHKIDARKENIKNERRVFIVKQNGKTFWALGKQEKKNCFVEKYFFLKNEVKYNCFRHKVSREAPFRAKAWDEGINTELYNMED